MSRGFTSIAILTLGLGIGASTAIFSIVNGVLLQPLAFSTPERIVTLATRFENNGRLTPRLSGGDLLDLQQDTAAEAFQNLAAYHGGEVGLQINGRAEFAGDFFVNSGYFQILDRNAIAGRLLTSDDVDRSTVVSRAFADRHFGGPAGALGRTITVEHRAYDVVGVIVNGYPSKAEVWIPLPAKPSNLNRTAYNYPLLGRLKPNVAIEQAQTALNVFSARLEQQFPATNSGKRIVITPLRDQLVGPSRQMLFVLLGAVGFVLLIACANVANLLLARSLARSREFAVRVALGAGKWQIVRQLAVESAILGLAGGALGLLIVFLSLDTLVRLAPQLPRIEEIHVSLPVFAFTMVCSLAASLLFGLAPAMEAIRTDVNTALKRGGSRGAVGGGSHRTRKALVIVEVALSVTLAIGAGLLFRSFLELQRVELGYRAGGILVMYTHVPARDLNGHVAATRHFESLFTELASIPGVSHVAGAMGLPTGRYGSNGKYQVEGVHSMDRPDRLPDAGFRLASSGYFETLGIPLRQGREFSPRDQFDAPFVAIISESLARQSFPNTDPIGKRIRCGLDSDKWMTIVGVVGDVRQNSPASRPEPELYMPVPQHPFFANELQVVMRTAQPPTALISAVQAKMGALSPSAAIKFTTLETMVSDSMATPRFRTLLLTAFATLALLLAMAGIYGVMNYLVSRRTAEFGLRVALGAQPEHLLWATLREAIFMTAIGLAIGVTLSLSLSKILASMLFGLAPIDVTTYLIAIASILVVTILAAITPAWRASSIDPMTALRQD
jgi:predicted permease